MCSEADTLHSKLSVHFSNKHKTQVAQNPVFSATMASPNSFIHTGIFQIIIFFNFGNYAKYLKMLKKMLELNCRSFGKISRGRISLEAQTVQQVFLYHNVFPHKSCLTSLFSVRLSFIHFIQLCMYVFVHLIQTAFFCMSFPFVSLTSHMLLTSGGTWYSLTHILLLYRIEFGCFNFGITLILLLWSLYA